MPAPLPPGVTITRAPSMSGDSLINQPGLLPPNSLKIFLRQTGEPSGARRQTRSPFSVSAYTRSLSTVGVERGPLPRPSFTFDPRAADQTLLPSARFRQKTTLELPLVPCTKIRSPLIASEP